MNRRILAVVVLAVLTSVIMQSLVFNEASAQMGPIMNPGPDYTPLKIDVSSPVSKQVYGGSGIMLVFKITKPDSWFTSGATLWNYGCQGEVTRIHYSLDGQASINLAANDTGKGISTDPISPILTYDLALPQLSPGIHTLLVSAEGKYDYWTSDLIYNKVESNPSKIQFYVDDGQHAWGGTVTPPESVEPPKIVVSSPNHLLYTTKDVPLTFEANIASGISSLNDLGYRVTLQNGTVSTYHLNAVNAKTVKETMLGLPDGIHKVTVFATGIGTLVQDGKLYGYEIEGTSTVNFTVDEIVPKIRFDLGQNQTYQAAKVTLNFTSNKQVPSIIYSLDDQANITAPSGQTLTLDNLPNGKHTITIYAQDEYGVISQPDALSFAVDAFPTLTIGFLAVVAFAICGTALAYWKYTKTRRPEKSVNPVG